MQAFGPPGVEVVTITMENGKLIAQLPSSATPVTTADAELSGFNTFDNIALEAAKIFLHDVVELRNAELAVDEDGEGQMEEGSQVKSPTGDGSVRVASGGTLVAQGAEENGNSSPPVVIDTALNVEGGNVVVQPGATLTVNGPVTANNANIVSTGDVNLNGSTAIENTTITQQSVSGSTIRRRFRIANAGRFFKSLVIVKSNADAEITLPSDANRDEVKDLEVKVEEGNAIINGFLNNPATLGGTGRLIVRALRDGDGNPVFINSVVPGNSAGRLNLTGDLNSGPGSDIQLEIGGTAQATQHDLFAVTGLLDVSFAFLRPLLINGFQSSITSADTFTVIETTEPIVGNFANVFNGRVSTPDGSFRVTFTENRTHVVLDDFIAAPDTDNDGMSDAFETQFGFNPNDPADAAADADGDGEDNLAEFRSETDPTDPNSVTRSGRTLNISTRLRVLPGDNALIAGYIITGSDPKTVIVRALGPSLQAVGVPDTLVNPTLELFDSSGQSIGFNNDWKDSQQAEIEGTTIPPTNDLESAIVLTLNPGAVHGDCSRRRRGNRRVNRGSLRFVRAAGEAGQHQHPRIR